MVDRFTTTLDCVDHTFIADDLLDRLPAPAQVGPPGSAGSTSTSPAPGALSAVLALSAASGGFTVAEFTAKVHAMTGHTGYTIRQAAYDLRKLRGKELITKPGRTRRYHLSPQTAGTITALLTLREQVIAPILAGVRSPHRGRKPATWTSVDRDYEKIRIDMQTLFQDLGIRAAGKTTSCRSGFRKRLDQLPAEFRVASILEALNEHRVEYVVIGGVAAVLYGAEVSTLELDAVIEQSRANRQRAVDALWSLEAPRHLHAGPRTTR